MSSMSVNTRILTDFRKAKAGVWKKSSSVVQMASAPPMIAVWRTTMSFGSQARDECRVGSDHSRHRLQEHHVVVDPAFGHTVPGTHPGVTEHSRRLGEDRRRGWSNPGLSSPVSAIPGAAASHGLGKDVLDIVARGDTGAGLKACALIDSFSCSGRPSSSSPATLCAGDKSFA